ncbi:hypothetical protein [Streptomyces axinellae]|jgi:hypothetical protein|uniref:Uncharacterized protein n=1 Tax=Streptomyces axinellae TaxID=552788 RepID=A0ABP6DBY9_9ACTN
MSRSMSRSKKLVATCALALGVVGAVAAPALADGPVKPSERNSTSVPERNSTLAPIAGVGDRTVAAGPTFHVLDRNATLAPGAGAAPGA